MRRMHCVLNVLLLFAFRTSVSIHLMEWSPDGEYFATAGKVREQAKKKINIQTKQLKIPLRSFSVLSSIN